MTFFGSLFRGRNDTLHRAATDAEAEASQMLLVTLQQLIEEKNRTDVILNNLDEGVMLLDETRAIQPGYSPLIGLLFETGEVDGSKLEDLVFEENEPEQKKVLAEFLDAVIASPNAAGEFIDTMNPIAKVDTKNKTLAFRFARTIAGKDSERLVVVVRDVSGQEQLDKALEAEKKKGDAELGTLACVLRFGKKTIRHFFEEAAATFGELNQLIEGTSPGKTLPSKGVEASLRRIHSVKSNAQALGFESIAGRAHELETLLTTLQKLPLSFASNMKALVAAGNFQEEVSRHEQKISLVLEKAFGDDAQTVADDGAWTETLEAFRQLTEALGAPGNEETRTAMRDLQDCLDVGAGGAVEVLSAFLEHHLRQIEGDKRVDWRLETVLKALPAHLANRLRDCLLHLIRNAVDHGIEPVEERLAAGKPGRGTIVLKIARKGSAYLFSLRDDGRGVNWKTLGALAATRGLSPSGGTPKEDRSKLLALLLRPGFTTRAASVTPLSGRGIGLDAVAEQVQSWGGAIRLLSRAGHGMAVTFRIPS